jgi:beta-N-acetylhexosaminidase
VNCARLLCVGFEGPTVNAPLREVIARGVRSVILFARNFENPAQLKRLCADIKSLAPRGERILICVDHEGGRVVRFDRGFTPIPYMREIGAAGDETAARHIGRTMARELRAAGIDLNLAPVLDVDSNPANPVIGHRSFSRDPQIVARLSCAMIEGMQAAPSVNERVAACGKHFPGHGDTSVDSHFELPRLPHDLKRLREVELVPFAAAMRANVASIMTAHVMFEALDREAPATMSKAAIDGVLRRDLGFDGVVISDDLEMKAIADHFGVENGAIRAVTAGVDLVMCCHTPQRQHAVIDALTNAAADGAISRDRVVESIRRLDALRERYVG